MNSGSWMEEFMENLRIRKALIKYMSDNKDYALWLKSYLMRNIELTDDINPYDVGEKTEAENIKNLSVFYEVICEYANKNYMYPTDTEFGNYYKLLIDELSIELGFINGQGTVFYANLAPIEEGETVINFDDILSKKVHEGVPKINKILDGISYSILEAYNNGVPVNAIIDRVNKSVDTIKHSEGKKLELKK